MDLKALYVHFPYCIKKCNYCDFFREAKNDANFESYHQLLRNSIEKHQIFMKENSLNWAPLETIYIGGGTPSYWGLEGANFLKTLFNDYKMSFAQNYEFTLEVNPGTNFINDFSHWESLGVNRYSVGIQSFDDGFLKILDRVHNKKEAKQLLQFLNEKDVNYSVDLMIGLPFSRSEKRNIISEINEILEFSPKHISMYILTVTDQYRHYNDLPSEEWVREEYLTASRYLQEHGYEHYEISNWAKEGLHSKHNMRYWSLDSWAALGPSASGTIFLKSNEGKRYTWDKYNPECLEEILDEKEIQLEKIFLSLRTSKGINIEDCFSRDQICDFNNLAQKWIEKGYANKTDSGVALTDEGYLLFNSLMDDIFLNVKNL